MNYNILIVDDTRFMRMMLSDILNNYGHKVVAEAANGLEAVKLYGEHQPDVVIMDINMPVMNGIDAMKEIKHHDPSAIILICAAMSQQDFISDALKLGAAGYVLKPFEAVKVNEVVCKFGLTRVSQASSVESFMQNVPNRLSEAQSGSVNEADSITNLQDGIEPYKFQEETQPEIHQEEELTVTSDLKPESLLSIGVDVMEEEQEIQVEESECASDLISYELHIETDDATEEEDVTQLQQEQEISSTDLADHLTSDEAYDELHLDFHEYLAQIQGDKDETDPEQQTRELHLNAGKETAQVKMSALLSPAIAQEPFIKKTHYENSNVINLSSGIYCSWDEYVADSIVTYKVMMNDGETVFMEVYLESGAKCSVPFSLNSLRRLLEWADAHQMK